MKRPLQSFISFSRTERLGLIGLLFIMLVLLIIRGGMQYWVQPSPDPVLEQKLITTLHDSTLTTNNLPVNTKINLNTADSATLVSINGIGPTLAHRIIQHRPFKSYNQLFNIPRFPHYLVDTLKHITVLK